MVKGIDFLLYANTGTDAVPVWTKIAGQRGATLNRSAETMESTSKDSTGWKEFEQSFKEWSIEAEGLLVDGDAGYLELEEAFNNGTKLKVELKMDTAGDKWTGSVIVTDLPVEMPYDDLVSYSVTLQGSGALTKTEVA